MAVEFCVTKKSGEMVGPCGKTPSGTVLQLSVIDRLPVLRCNARTLHVYSHGGGGAAEVIRAALSKTLIPYYPLAGRLRTSISGDVQIECCGEGVWFVEATADCILDELDYFSIPYEKLLPSPPPSAPLQVQQEEGEKEDDPLVQMQVTQFECGGFVIGLIFCHSVCDGLGAAQFLNAIGEIARGAHKTSINPQWCRDFLPNNNHPDPLSLKNMMIRPPIHNHQQLEHASMDISADRIKELKHEFQESTGGLTCSTFELVAALLWRQRTRAINPKEGDGVNQLMRLVFFASCRGLIRDPPLPKGFYGNCFFPVTLTLERGTLMESSLVQVVKLIQQAKAGLPNQFQHWVTANYCSDPDPFAPPLEYGTLFISEWGRLGFNDVDFGWGGPVHVVPIQGSTIIPVGIVWSQPNNHPNREGLPVRLLTWCVHQPHLQPLLHHMTSSS